MSTYSIDADLRTKVLSLSGVSALVGTRVYADQAAQSATLPYIVFTMNQSEKTKTINSGVLKSGKAIYTLRIWHDSKVNAMVLANLISQPVADGGLDGFRGTMGNVFVQCCFCGEVSHNMYAPQSGEELPLYSAEFDLDIMFNRA